MADKPKVAKITLVATKVTGEEFTVLVKFYSGTTEAQINELSDWSFQLFFGGNPNMGYEYYPQMSAMLFGYINEDNCLVMNRDRQGSTLPAPAPQIDLPNQGPVKLLYAENQTDPTVNTYQSDIEDGFINFEYIPPSQD